MSDMDTAEDLTLNPIARLTRDLRQGAATLGDKEARYLVDAYYIIQEDRKRSKAQATALEENEEPHSVISWLYDQSATLEKQIQSALDVYTQNHMMGSWMRQIHGIGPVISAGLLANIYMGLWCSVCRGHSEEDCMARQANKKLKLEPHIYQPIVSIPTVGHIYQYAGIAGDDQRPWEKGQKRPWNADLKTLCWKAGQSFMKFSNHEQCFYGRLYRERKEASIIKNEGGGFAPVAAIRVETVGKSTDAYKFYSEGKLPPAHLDAMARRYAVKLFLSHMHEVWFWRRFRLDPPKPFAIAMLHHGHYIPPPVPRDAGLQPETVTES